MEEWELRYRLAGALPIPFARGVCGATDALLVQAAPDHLCVAVRRGGAIVARAEGLRRTCDTPVARLTRAGGRVVREDIWPGPAEVGQLVLLPSGEVGRLRHAWHAPDLSQWSWEVRILRD